MEDQLTVILITRSFWRAKIGKCQILILNSERKKKQLILWTLRRNWYGLSLYYFSGKRRPLLHPNTAQRSFFHYDLQGHRTTVFFKISVRKCGAYVDLKDKDGQTALHYALMYSPHASIEVLNCLIKNEADVNAFTFRYETPLMLASYFGHVNAMDFVIDYCC